MPVYLPKKKIEEIFAEYGADAKNTGSVEGQAALFTFRIKELSVHLQSNHKDHTARRRLLTLVGKRKSMLNYLAKKDITKYRELIVKLGIRK